MSEPPRDDRADDPAGSAPWERPRRWNQQRLDATRVDDLLARLGNEDEMGGRRRRRRAAEDADAGPNQGAGDERSAEDVTEISASELIAALRQQQPDQPDNADSADSPAGSAGPDGADDTDGADEPHDADRESADSSAAAATGATGAGASAASAAGVGAAAADAAGAGAAGAATPGTEPTPDASTSNEPAADRPAATEQSSTEQSGTAQPGTAQSGEPTGAEQPGVPPPGTAQSGEPTGVIGDAADPGSRTGEPARPAAEQPATDDQGPDDPEKTSVIAAATRPPVAPGGPGVVTMPGYDDDSRTDQLPQIGPFEDVASIRESLRRQHAADPAYTGPDEPKGKAGKNKQDRPGKSAAPVAAAALAGNSGRHHRSIMWAGRSVIAVIAAALLVFVGVKWNAWTSANDTLAAENAEHSDVLDTADSNIATPSSKPPATEGGAGAAEPPLPQYEPENILLLGSDTRAGDNGDDTNSNGSDTGAQSDTLMIAHLSADRQNVTVLSVPRDLQIKAPECKIWNSETGKVSDEDQPVDESSRWKITNAYAVGGPKCTVKAVQALTGLRIDRVIGIDFNGFKSMVDALDGINLNVCKRIYDDELGLIVADGGEQVVHGDQALSLVRARKVADDGYGNDYGRIHRQQVVLSAILRQVTSSGTLLDPGSKLDNFLKAFTDATFTVNIDLDFLVDLARQLGDLSPGKVTFYTLPAHDNPNDGGDSQILDEERAQAVFTALVNDQRLPGEDTTPAPKTSGSGGASSAGSTSSGSSASSAAGSSVGSSPQTSSSSAATTSSGAPEPQLITVEPDAIDLQVVNVTGTPGIATNAQLGLNSLGFNIPDELLLRSDDEVTDGITVQYSAGNRDAALTVAAAVPGSTLTEVPDLGSRVRLMLGTSYTGELAGVAVGEELPDRLQSTAENFRTEQPAAPAAPTDDPETSEASDAAPSSAQPGPAGEVAGPSGSADSSMTLGEDDLERINANESTCA